MYFPSNSCFRILNKMQLLREVCCEYVTNGFSIVLPLNQNTTHSLLTVCMVSRFSEHAIGDYILKVKVAQWCLTLSRILQARILKWVAFSFSRGFYQPRDRTQVSLIAGRFFTS